MSFRSWNRARALSVVVAVLAMAAVFAGAGAPVASAAPDPPKLGAGEPGDVAESIATKITDPSFTRLIFNLIKDEETGPTIVDVMRELATINRKLDVLDRKLDEIAAQVAEIRTNQYWIELQKYMSAIGFVQDRLVEIGKERDADDRQGQARALARYIQDNLAPYRKSFQNFVLTVPGGRKGIIAALSDQQKVGLRFWGPKETENLREAYNSYAAFQALLAAEVAQAKVALASPAQRERAELDAREIGAEALEAIAKQKAELPRGMTGTTSWQIDLQSRLIWVTRPGAAPVDLSRALAEVGQSRVGGFGDWRVPADPDYEALGPGCAKRSFREPCAFASFLDRKGWRLPTSCGGRNIWWTTTPQAGKQAGFIWADIPPMSGQTAHNPGTACVFQIRGVGAGESYWM